MNVRHVVPVALALGCLVTGFLVGRRPAGARQDAWREAPGNASGDASGEALDWQALQPDALAAAAGEARLPPVVQAPEPVPEERDDLGPGAIFSVALMDHFEREFRGSWEATRTQPLTESDLEAGGQAFEQAVLALPAQLGQALARERNEHDAFREAVAGGDGVALVEAVARGEVAFGDGELDDDLYDRVLRPRANAAAVDGPAFDAGDAVAVDGMTLRFGPGMHTLRPERLEKDSRGSFPSDLTLRGAGIDATLLSLDESLSARTAIRRLHVVDLTLDCDDNYLFDARRGVVTLELDGVRVVRFDIGAGSSLVFGTRDGLLVRARRCEFLDGYGFHPGSGRLFRGAALVASFQDCRFRRLRLGLDQPTRGQVRFVDCVFENYSEDPTLSAHALFERPVLLPLRTRDELRAQGRASLTDFFSAWTER